MELNLHGLIGDNMLKSIKIIVIIFVTAIFIQSCKSPTLDFEWFLFEAEGSYSAVDNTSYIKLNAWVEVNQSSININQNNVTDTTHFQGASVINWRYSVFEGEQLVFVVSDSSFNRMFGDTFLNVAKEQIDYLWVAILSENPITGDIFNGMNPDRVEVEMSIYDTDRNAYFISNSVPVQFTRK